MNRTKSVFASRVYQWLTLKILAFCFNPLLFCCSWRADHCAKNWGSNWGDGGSVPCNVHQVPPGPFRQVQDPVWPERERCPVHPVKGRGGLVEALNSGSIFRPPPSPLTRPLPTPSLSNLGARFGLSLDCNLYTWTRLLKKPLPSGLTHAHTHTHINTHMH